MAKISSIAALSLLVSLVLITFDNASSHHLFGRMYKKTRKEAVGLNKLKIKYQNLSNNSNTRIAVQTCPDVLVIARAVHGTVKNMMEKDLFVPHILGKMLIRLTKITTP